MKFDFVKNIQFTKLIKINGQLREFNFRKSNATHEGFFSVDVSDDRGNRIMFSMEVKDGQWIIMTPGLPKWVSEQEAIFSNIIIEEMK